MAANDIDQSKLDEIIVKGKLLERDLHDTMPNVPMISGAELEKSFNRNLFDVITKTAGVIEQDGATGDFIREKPPIGLAPSFGATVFSVISPLHFGNFAGYLSKVVWIALGFASSYVIMTGFTLWIQHRRAEPAWALFEHFVIVFSSGLSLSIAVNGMH